MPLPSSHIRMLISGLHPDQPMTPQQIADEKAMLLEQICLKKLENADLRRQIEAREAAWEKDVLERKKGNGAKP